MNEFRVLTVHDLDFLDDKGRPVKGMHLWVIGESVDPAWNGYEVLKIWIPDGHRLEPVVVSLKHDDKIHVTFDRRGKPFAIEVV